MSSTEELPEIRLEDLSEATQKAVRDIGWEELMPVQAKAIPYMLAGRDVMVQSRTGSGKTGAFLIPAFERIDPEIDHCQVIIMVPTRELARQVAADAEKLARGRGLRSAAVYGGVGYGEQLRVLKEGAHLVVGTPGRILDHLMRRSFHLDKVRVLIFDEADRMLSMGFYPDMKALARYLPKKRSGYMFSATFPPLVLSLSRQFLNEPEMLSLSAGSEHVAETTQVYYEVNSMEKDRGLIRIIEVENPDSAIIFCNTKAQTHYVMKVLQRFGYDADELSADLSQSAREQVLAKVYGKKLRFLVATDVAARGIDIDNLSHVILYDFPEDHESYIHRTGRTGRAGAGGEAISLVGVLEKLELKAVAKRYGIDMERRELPTDEDVQAVVTERVTALLEAKLRGLDNLVRERMERMMPLARNLGKSDDELAVIAMLIDEYYQESLHAAPTPDGEKKSSGDSSRQSTGYRPKHQSQGGRGRGRRR